jgi:hypothetical protein
MEDKMRYYIVLFAALVLVGTSNAQVKVNINFNLNTQPAWGPTGYDYVEYYYLPDIDVYYCVPTGLFYYSYRGQWVGRKRLPSRYSGFDLYHSYKVVLNEKEPWRYNKGYVKEYAKYKNHRDQEVIRDSRDPKYFQNKYHPEHKKWVKEHKNKDMHDRGKHKGKGHYKN